MSETSFKRLKFTRYIHFAISVTFLGPIFIKVTHDNWCPKQLSKSSSLLYVQFAISLTFLRSIFRKITENKRSSDSLIVDFLKIACRYFFLCLYKAESQYKVINFVCNGIPLHGWYLTACVLGAFRAYSDFARITGENTKAKLFICTLFIQLQAPYSACFYYKNRTSWQVMCWLYLLSVIRVCCYYYYFFKYTENRNVPIFWHLTSDDFDLGMWPLISLTY